MTDHKLQEKASTIFTRLQKKYPNAKIELNFTNPLELTVATILSAQCTDKKVNEVTKHLFRKYVTPKDYLDTPQEEFENDIRPLGFYRRKTQSIRKLMQALQEKHNGNVPADLKALTALPGVGRKTANVILGAAFDIPGIAVDTHVKRVSNRLGLTQSKQPDKIEQDLMKLHNKRDWVKLSHVLIFHGRYTCKAKKPDCDNCPVTELCDYYQSLS